MEKDLPLCISVTLKSKAAIPRFLDDTEKSALAYELDALKVTATKNKVKSDCIDNSFYSIRVRTSGVRVKFSNIDVLTVTLQLGILKFTLTPDIPATK